MWIETQRLVLREFQRDDVQSLAPILADPRVMQFSPTGPLSTEQTQAKIDEFIALYKTFGFGKWAVLAKDNHELMGYCGIALETIDGNPEREFGYRLAPPFWGRGLATEAATAAMGYGFCEFKLPYMLGLVERKNAASVKILKKLGMQFERDIVLHGANVDIYRVDIDRVDVNP